MNLRTLLLFAVLCVCWGIPYFFIKLALVDVSPVCVAWGRITLGALVLIPVAWRQGTLQQALRHKGAILAFAVTELVIPFSLIAIAETALTSSLTGVLIATLPLGVAVIGYAAGPLVVQRYLKGVDEISSVALSLGSASVMLLPFAFASRPTSMPSALSFGSIAVLGFISTAAALLLYFYVIHAAGAARASVVAYISPAIATVLGVVALHEHFGMGIAVGLALILIGSGLGSGGGAKAAAAHN